MLIRSLILALMYICILIPSSYSQQYEEIGDMHNSSVNEIVTNPINWNKNEREQFEAIIAHINEVKKSNVIISYEDFRRLYDKYGTMTFYQAINNLLSEGKINLKQYSCLRSIDSIASIDNDSVFLSNLSVIEEYAKTELSEYEQKPILAFIVTTRYSYNYWKRYIDDITPYYNSSGKQTLRFNSLEEILQCKRCIRENRWRIILADGFGALLGVIVCVATQSPIVCIINIIGTAAGFSIETICRLCNVQCTWCPRP